MVDVGIAGPMGTLLAWFNAALLVAALALGARVAWTVRARGLCRASVRVGGMVVLLCGGLAGGVLHFATAPQSVRIAVGGDWTAYSAYGNTLWVLPAEEARQVRLESPLDCPKARLHVRRTDGDAITLYGHELPRRLGYQLRMCGAWEERPVWGPHRYSAAGPECLEAPGPAALERATAVPLAWR
jgi:hypothetical protein